MSIPLVDVITHDDVPTTTLHNHQDFNPTNDVGVTKYQASLPKNTQLEALLINKQSDVLVVSFHGAVHRRTKKLPRFEWMRTLRETPYSSLYFSDPGLHLKETLSLSWFTGWKEFDLQLVIANWITAAATAVGATRVILLGSSAGGFAALQIAPHVPDSLALAFNCQTRISKYRVYGTHYGPQRAYLRHVMPHLTPEHSLEDLGAETDWSSPMGERLSVVHRYQRPQPNYVYYVQNMRDYHHVDDHYLPFMQAVEDGPNIRRVRFVEYQGAEAHVPPSSTEFYEHLTNAVEWLRS